MSSFLRNNCDKERKLFNMVKNDITVHEIADILRNKRMQKDYTIEKLSELSEVSIGSISGIENKKRSSFSVTTLLNLMNALDIGGDEIFGTSNKNVNELIHENQQLKTTIRTMIDTGNDGLSK